MKIAVDIRPLAYPGTGNATYLFHILKETILLSKKKNWEWLFISHKGIHPHFLEILKENVELSVESSIMSRLGPLWFHYKVPKILKKHNVNVFWSTLFLLPYHFKKRIAIPTLLNIHDLTPWIAPDTMQFWEKHYLKLFTKNSLMNADYILCLSHTTKNLLEKNFPSLHIHTKSQVIYPGIQPPPQNRKKPIQMPLEVQKFFFSVGTLEPRKNFETLIQAYIRAKKEYTYLPPLIIAGKPGWNMSDLLIQLSKNLLKNHHIYFISSPSNEELYWLYENCSLFLFPSIYEGFGLPILEAALFKKPQVLSGIEIFKEIGSHLDGIHYISDARNPEAWKEMILFFSDDANIKKLHRKIKNTHLKIFNYKNSAKEIIKAIQQWNSRKN